MDLFGRESFGVRRPVTWLPGVWGFRAVFVACGEARASGGLWTVEFVGRVSVLEHHPKSFAPVSASVGSPTDISGEWASYGDGAGMIICVYMYIYTHVLICT